MAIRFNDDDKLSNMRGVAVAPPPPAPRLSASRIAPPPPPPPIRAGVGGTNQFGGITRKQRQYASELGFRPEELPTFRSEQQNPSLTNTLFDVLGRFESGAAGLAQGVLQGVRNKEDIFSTVGRGLRYGGEGLLGDTQFTAGTLYSQLVDDPYARQTFDANTLNTLRSGGARLAANIVGGMAIDPTTYIPLAGIAKGAGRVAKAVPGVEKGLDAAQTLYKTSDMFKPARAFAQDVAEKFTTTAGRFGGDKVIEAMKRNSAVRAELSGGMNKFLKGELDDKGFIDLVVDTRSALKRAGASDNIVENVVRDLQGGFDQIKSLKSSGVNLAEESIQKQLQRQATGLAKGAEASQEFQRIIDPVRRIIDDFITPELVNKGLVSAETAGKNSGEYLRAIYKQLGGLDDPEVVNTLKKLSDPGLKFGTELDALKRKKDNVERFFEFVSERPGELPSDLSQDVITSLFGEYNTKVAQLAEQVGPTQAKIDAAKELSQKVLTTVGADAVATIANDQRVARGLIEDFSTIGTTTIDQGLKLIEKHSFFKTLAEEFSQKFASGAAAAEAGFKQLPDTAKYGELAGKYIPRALANDIIGIASPPAGWFSKVTGLWKQAMLFAPFQTATNSRNFISNIMLMTLGEDAPSVPQAIQKIAEGALEVEKKGKIYQEFRGIGGLASNFADQELKSALRGASGTGGILDKIQDVATGGAEALVPGIKNLPEGARKAIKATTSTQGARVGIFGFGQEAFEFTESAGKVGLYKWYREVKGFSPEKALELTEKSLFNYAKLPGFLSSGTIPGLGIKVSDAIPFLSFKYFATQLALDTVLNRTSKLTGVGKVSRGVESLTLDQEDEFNLPGYIKSNRQNYVRLPWLDEQGNPKYLDLTYLLPFGEVAGGFEPQDIILGNPFLRTATEVGTGRSLFFDRPIVEPGTPQSEVIPTTIGYAIQQLAPRTPLLPGSRMFDKLSNTISGRPDRYGRYQDPGTAFADVFLGIKAREVDPGREAKYNQIAIQQAKTNINSQINRVKKDQSLNTREKKQRIDQLNNEIRRIELDAKSGVFPRL